MAGAVWPARRAKGAVLVIAALVLWMLNAGLGLALLSSGNAARRRAARPARAASTPPGSAPGTPPGPAPGTSPGSALGTPPGSAPGTPPGSAPGTPMGPAAVTSAGSAAVPLTEDGRPPRVPRSKVVAPPGEHPLLEFSHPALVLAGLGFWFAFALVHYRAFAWISLGVLVATAGAGLGWLARNRLAARRRTASARAFPPRLIALHGLAATALFALTLLTALSTARG